MTEAQRSRSPSHFPRLPQNPVYDPHYHNEHRARRARLRLPPLDPRNRFPGDGFDFRRPVMAPIEADRLENAQRNSHTETIDLTRDAEPETVRSPSFSRAQRLPRYGRDIIDISSSDDEGNTQPARTNTQTSRPLSRTRLPSLEFVREIDSPLFVPQDDDVQVLRSRPISRLASRNTSVMPGVTDAGRDGSLLIDLTEDIDDDVTLVESRPISSINRHNPILSGHARVREAEDVLAQARGRSRLHDRITAHYDDLIRLGRSEAFRGWSRRLFDYLPVRPDTGIHHHAHNAANRNTTRTNPQTGTQARPGGISNITMDYRVPGFDLGTGARQSPAPQQYQAPDPPASGFTRNPTEDEEIVCPNCGSELAIGEEEAQRQVWVIKHCGHVSMSFPRSDIY